MSTTTYVFVEKSEKYQFNTIWIKKVPYHELCIHVCLCFRYAVDGLKF